MDEHHEVLERLLLTDGQIIRAIIKAISQSDWLLEQAWKRDRILTNLSGERYYPSRTRWNSTHSARNNKPPYFPRQIRRKEVRPFEGVGSGKEHIYRLADPGMEAIALEIEGKIIAITLNAYKVPFEQGEIAASCRIETNE